MARGGRRYSLVIYTVMMNHWWPGIFALGLALIGLAWGIYWRGFEGWRWILIGLTGAAVLFIGMVMFAMRKTAFVQPFRDHLRLVTPFLKLNISYKRIRQTFSSTMAGLFPPSSVSGWKRDVVEHVAKMTAVVIELNALPIPRSTLNFFLSPLFFKDKTPHFVLLVEDWMRFSSELESLRVDGVEPAGNPVQRDSSILSKLPRNQ